MEEFKKTEEELKKELAPELYEVAREKGTEMPFSGKYYYSEDDGIYRCSVCNNPLFDSGAKFDSGTGWPSFYQPINPNSIKLESDGAMGMERMEVLCGKCNSHLGHVFDDAPQTPTGKRYCINSICLDLEDKS